MKILAIDDDRNVLHALEGLLQDEGHEITCCNGAKEGLERLSADVYDLILVDYRMPENDGIWFMEHAEVPSSTKVLLMTAYANRVVINEMFRLGISGYLVKPFGREDLVRHLQFHTA